MNLGIRYIEADAQNLHMPYIHRVEGLWVHDFITIFMAFNIPLLFLLWNRKKFYLLEININVGRNYVLQHIHIINQFPQVF